jgi:hypothetical protein
LDATKNVVETLGKYGVKVILDYGVEGKEGEDNFDQATATFIEVIKYASTQKNIPFISIKVTGLASHELLQTLHEAPRLRSGIHDNEMEQAAWDRVRERMYAICEAAAEKNIGVLVAVILEDDRSRSNFHSIDHNYFGLRTPLASNGGEIIRVGVSEHCEFNSNTIIEANFFEKCDGETEIISIKSCQNIVKKWMQ